MQSCLIDCLSLDSSLFRVRPISGLLLRNRAPRARVEQALTPVRDIGHVFGRFKLSRAPVFASQRHPFSRRLPWNILEPSSSALPRPGDRPCGVRQRRLYERAPRRCANPQHSHGCFGAWCPPYSGKRSRSVNWSLPPDHSRRWSIGYIVNRRSGGGAECVLL